jgi:hypothetical protein
MAISVSEALVALKTMDEPTALREIAVIEQEIKDIKVKVKEVFKQRRSVIALLRKFVKGTGARKASPHGEPSPTETKILGVLKKHGASDAATIAKLVGVPVGPITVVLHRCAATKVRADGKWEMK